MKTLYLLIHLFTISFPLIWSFEPKIHYAKKWKALFPALILTGILFIFWDAIFTHLGIWGFNEMYILGIHLLGLPAEEWLFFITIPFACLFIYESVIYFFPEIKATRLLRIFTLIIALFLVLISIIHNDKAYTFWSFLFTGTCLIYTGFKYPPWMGKFWLTYLLHLIPFLLVDGILTGTFIEEEVVWYNNQENLSIRAGTIPIEDFVYTLLLLLFNITLYEQLKKYYKLKT